MIPEAVIVAIVVATPPTIAAFLAFRASREANDLTREIHRQTQSTNGSTVAETVERTQREVKELQGDLTHHITVQHGRGPIKDREVIP